MPMTEPQRAQLRPLLADLAARCAGLAPPERVRVIRTTLESAGVSFTWEEWAGFVREEPGTIPAALARPDDPP